MSPFATEGDTFEVLTMGRVGVDFYPTTHGSIVDVDIFQKFLGGSPTNVAVAAARLGHRSAVITRTGADEFGRFVHAALVRYGVDDRFVLPVEGSLTPVTFCETHPPDHFPIYFYREPKAPDLEIATDELDLGTIKSAGLFWATVSGLSVEPSRGATYAALASREHRHPTVLDLDYRPTFWTSREEARHAARRALTSATVAVGNLDEVEVAVGTREPDEAAEALLGLGVELAVIKLGGDGVVARSLHERAEAAPVEVPVVNGLGAGDAFGGALCHGLLEGWPLEETLRFANAAGAIVASRLACSEAMPNAEEVRLLLERGHL